jgi:hypothetical protein
MVIEASRRPGEVFGEPRVLINNASENVARQVYDKAVARLRRGYVLLLDPSEACAAKTTRHAEATK